MQKDDIKYWIWISKLDLNPSSLKNYFEKNSVKDIWRLKENIEIFFTKEEIERIKDNKYRQNLQKEEAFLKSYGIRLLTVEDEDYPIKLRSIPDPPIVLYALGNIDLLSKKNIAIVGARKCTSYGQHVAKAFSYLLSKENFVITSGLAQGIDTASHEGALISNGKTIAVMGTGMDIIYPKENKKLFQEIVRHNGLILSEYPLGTKPDRLNFPKRNRIISGISDGVLVVEAGLKSGALITADFALDQGKNVYAIPRKHYK